MRIRMNRYVGVGVVLMGLGAGIALAMDSLRCGQRSLAHATELEPDLPQLTAAYQYLMGLDDWKLTVVSYGDTTQQRRAFTQWNLVKRTATVSYNLPLLEPETTWRVVVHELSHLWQAELYWLATQESEAAAQLAAERGAEGVAWWPLWETCSHPAGGGR